MFSDTFIPEARTHQRNSKQVVLFDILGFFDLFCCFFLGGWGRLASCGAVEIAQNEEQSIFPFDHAKACLLLVSPLSAAQAKQPNREFFLR